MWLRQCLYSQGLCPWTTITHLSPRFDPQYKPEQASDSVLPILQNTSVFIYLSLCSIKDLNWLIHLKIISEEIKIKGGHGDRHQSQCGECAQPCALEDLELLSVDLRSGLGLPNSKRETEEWGEKDMLNYLVKVSIEIKNQAIILHIGIFF